MNDNAKTSFVQVPFGYNFLFVWFVQQRELATTFLQSFVVNLFSYIRLSLVTCDTGKSLI